MSQKLSALEITIANIIDDESLYPDAIKSILKKLKDLRPIAAQIVQSLQQAHESIRCLNENNAKVAGSFEALMGVIEETMPTETIEKYGKELKPQEKPNA